jgi:hypothetical protein
MYESLVVHADPDPVSRIDSSLHEDIIAPYSDLDQPFVRYHVREIALEGGRVKEETCRLHVKASARPPRLPRQAAPMEQKGRLQRSDERESCSAGAGGQCVVLTLSMELFVPRTNCRVGNEAEACTFKPNVMFRARASAPDTSQYFQVCAQTNVCISSSTL